MARLFHRSLLLWTLAVRVAIAQGHDCDVVTWEHRQPIEFICDGTTTESTRVTTFLACAPTDCFSLQGQPSVKLAENDCDSDNERLTIFTTGPIPGTTTLPAGPGEQTTVVVTEAPGGTGTVYTEGPVPGTSTILGIPGQPPVVVVTTTPGEFSTIFTHGPVPGTSIITERSGEPPIVVVTTTPGKLPTVLTEGPVPGTTTNTEGGSETIVVVTTVPDIVTSTTEGPTPGTRTFNPSPGDDTTTIIVTSPLTDSATSDEPETKPPITPDFTPTPSPTETEPLVPTFSCDQFGYLIQSKALYQVDIASGDQELVKNPVGDGERNVNAIAYHPTENIIYGVIQSSTGVANLIRISSDGDSEVLDEVPRSVGGSRYNLNVGEITDSLQFWFGAAGQIWFQMDLSEPGSPTYQTVIASGTADPEGRINDWVQVPGADADYLYSIGEVETTDPHESLLQRWSTVDHTWETISRLGHLVGEDHWGALYADNHGNMYGSENFDGSIYQFPIEGLTQGTQVPVRLAQGPLSSRNDGARCHAAELLIPS